MSDHALAGCIAKLNRGPRMTLPPQTTQRHRQRRQPCARPPLILSASVGDLPLTVTRVLAAMFVPRADANVVLISRCARLAVRSSCLPAPVSFKTNRLDPAV